MICTFIGHRDVIDIETKINFEIKRLINSGITSFISGSMGNFDKMCESAVRKLNGKLIFIPYNIGQIKK